MPISAEQAWDLAKPKELSPEQAWNKAEPISPEKAWDLAGDISPRGVTREWEEEKISPWKKAKDMALGIPEAGGALAGGFISMPIAGLAGLVGLPFGKANEWLEKTGEFSAQLFQPKTEMGQKITEGVATPFQWINEASKFYGDIVYDKTNNPNLAAGVATAFELVTYALLAKGVKTGIKGVKGKPRVPNYASMLKELEKLNTEPAKILANEIRNAPKKWEQWRTETGAKIVEREAPEISKKIREMPPSLHKPKMTVAELRAQKQVMLEKATFGQERITQLPKRGPLGLSPMEEGAKIYYVKRVLTDANTLLGKKGAISFRKEKLSPEQVAAKERLLKDVEAFRNKALEAGKEFEQYLKDEGLPANVIRAISELGQKEIPQTPVEKMYNATDAELERLNKPSVVAAYHGLKKAMIDISGNVKKRLLKQGGKAGEEAVIRHDLIRGAGSKSERLINEASNKIYGGLSKLEEINLNRVIQSRRTITIEGYKPEVKHPHGLGAKEHQAYLDTLPKEVLAKLNAKADLYFAEMKNQLSQLKQKGLITDESYQGLLKAGDYSPRSFLQHIDPERTYTFGGKKITVSDSGIKALGEGSEGLLQNNSRALLAQVVTRTQARIFRNEANQAFYKLATDIPDNGVVRLSKIAKKTKAGKFIYQKAPTGFEKVSVMVDGYPREMLMPIDMAREWIVNDPAINTQMANIIGWMSGSKVLKPMATGLNPEFAVTNMPRDIVHVWLTTHEYSPHMPIWMAQMGRDFVVTAKDAFTRKGAWIDYINEGGGMSFLTHQGRLTAKHKYGVAGKLQDVLGYAGETSEIWTRLALRKRALRNGKEPFEATWIARNYLDFSQGGWFIKGADTGIPYLNASIQATRGLARSASEKPLEFVYKSAELVGLSTGLYLANRYTNPECLKSVSDRDKVNNFIITTPFTYTDKNNEKRHLYFKIAKDQSQRLMCTVFENAVAKYLGEDINIDQITQAAQDLIPIIPTQTIPPSMDAILGYYANKDFWMNKNIWRGPEVKPSEEYTRFTHPALVKLGKTGLSPERTRYVLENFFTYGNIYTSMVGGGLRQIMDKLPGDVKESTMEEMLVGMPFVRKVLKSTHPYSKHRKELEDIKIAESTKRYRKTRDLDALCEIYYKDRDKSAKKSIFDFIKEQPPEDRMRLHQRFIRYGKVYDISDRRWWLNLASLAPEARATVYWTRWEQADDKEKKRLETQLPRIPGIISGKFILRLQQLKKKKP